MELEEGYLPFLVSDSPADVEVKCYAGLPENPFADMKPVFEAENADQKFYSIYKLSDQRLGFAVYNQREGKGLQQIAFLSADYRNWEVYVHPFAEENINPLRYPMGPIIMYYMTVNADAVLIHASCIYDGEKGRIFSGFSGTGKSTTSRIWADAGYLVINDDRLIIRKEADGFYAHNTPMYYADQPKKTLLNNVFLISHSPENRIKKLNGAIAVTRVLAFCIQNNFDPGFVKNNLAFLSDMCKQVQVYELGFVPDSKVIDFVRQNETK